LGQHYKFVCENCNYKSVVSGGIDGGFMSMTNTFECFNCLELFDKEIKVYSENDNKWTEINAEDIFCPTCKKRDIKTWVNRKCPKCSSEMKADNSFMMLWD